MPFNDANTVSALELGNIKVWLTLGEIEGTKIPILNPETSVPDKTTKGTVYFERWSGSRYSIHIQTTDYAERICEVWFKSPGGRIFRKSLRRILSPAMKESRVKGRKVHYWIDNNSSGSKLLTGKKIGSSTAMGAITVKLIQRNTVFEFTFLFRHQVDGEDLDEDSDFFRSETEDFDQLRDDSEIPEPPMKRRRILPSDTSSIKIGKGVTTCSTASTAIDGVDHEARPRRIETVEGGDTRGRIVEVGDQNAARDRLCALLEKCQTDILKQFDECLSAVLP